MAGRNNNLIPLNERSPEEQKKIASMGGKKSGENKRRRKAMREIASLFGNEDAPAPVIARLVQAGLLEYGESCSMDEALLLAQYSKALAGNTKAAEFVRDTAGQKPKDSVEVTTDNSEKLDEIINQLGGKGLKEGD